MNNKGQSALSLAASHLEPETLAALAAAESSALFPAATDVARLEQLAPGAVVRLDGTNGGRSGGVGANAISSVVVSEISGVSGGATKATPFSLSSNSGSSGGVVVIDAINDGSAEEGQFWLNFRASHSDGAVYGDLDPRFLERPLRLEPSNGQQQQQQATTTTNSSSSSSSSVEGTSEDLDDFRAAKLAQNSSNFPADVVTPLSINPTTREMRRGNFERNNPGRLMPQGWTNAMDSLAD